MLRRTDDNTRAVTAAIGTIIIFSLVVIAFVQYQNTVVPNSQRAAESDHSLQVKSQLSGLTSGVFQTSNSGDVSEQQINFGLSYGVPGVNPPPISGRIVTQPAGGDIIIKNARNDDRASNYWTGRGSAKSYETEFFTYDIGYARINTPPIQYEHGLLYENITRNTPLPDDNEYRLLSSQSIIKGDSITLYTLSGDIQLSRSGTATLQVHPVSAPSEAISLKNNTSTTRQTNLNITIPSRMPPRVWNETVLTDQMHKPFGCGLPNNTTTCTSTQNNVLGIKPSSNGVSIIMDNDTTYSFRMSRVHLTSKSQQTRIPSEEAQYVSFRRSESLNVRAGETVIIKAQASDRFSNGVKGVEVFSEVYLTDSRECAGNFDVQSAKPPTECINGDNLRQPAIDTTNEGGDVVFTYTAPDSDSVDGEDPLSLAVYKEEN